MKQSIDSNRREYLSVKSIFDQLLRWEFFDGCGNNAAVLSYY